MKLSQAFGSVWGGGGHCGLPSLGFALDKVAGGGEADDRRMMMVARSGRQHSRPPPPASLSPLFVYPMKGPSLLGHHDRGEAVTEGGPIGPPSGLLHLR